MNVLIYAGPAPSRDLVLQFSTQIVQQAATALTLVTGGGKSSEPLLQEALERLETPAGLPVTLRALPGDAQDAILAAARERPHDLAIFGRLHQTFARLLPGPRSKRIAERLDPAVLRVQGPARPIRRILMASGGAHQTVQSVDVVARLAMPLKATVTILHVLSQQSLIFEGFPDRELSVEEFLEGSTPEASTLREAAAIFEQRGVPALIKGCVGPVLDEIVAELRGGNYDLLVIGAHRVTSALDRILLEDMTGELLDISPRPVMVVKATTGKPK